jgi:FkbM family methyltransferase
MANFELNELTNATALRLAAGETSGSTSLAVAAYGHEGQNTVGTQVVNPKVSTARLEEVEMRQLDDILLAEQVDRVDFVKIDVEGSEPRVLAGARATLERHRPLLQLEVEPDWLHRQGTSLEEVFHLLGAANYDVWTFDRTSGTLRRLREDDTVNGNVIAGPRGWKPS